MAGAAVDQSSFQLDGGENTNDMDGSMSVYTPSYAGDPTGGVANQSNGVAAGATGVMPTPADSVEEFKVNVAGMGADFNSSAGAQVQIATKRGTDQWHGTGYEYYLDNNLNANTWQNNYSGIPNPSFHYNRFGGAVGGPIIAKKILGGKTYFFANYEGFRFPQVDHHRKGSTLGGDAAWVVAIPGCERRDAGLQPQSHAGDLQRCHLQSCAVSRRSLRPAGHRNQSAGPANVEQVRARVERERL